MSVIRMKIQCGECLKWFSPTEFEYHTKAYIKASYRAKFISCSNPEVDK